MEIQTQELLLVHDERKLAEIAAIVRQSTLVALDTEFVRERTYFPQLCLIQIAAGDTVAGIDCLADLDLATLLPRLFGEGNSWIMHSARQDLEVLWNEAHKLPVELIDTQVAGALTGLPPQLGLQGLLEELLGVSLEKTHTRTDWSRRPLSEAALRYALDDVRYLVPAWQTLETRLRELGRLHWFKEECQQQLESALVSEPITIFERLRGTGVLASRNQAAALSLVAWREAEAQSMNRPRRWVLTDEQLLRLASQSPSSAAELERVHDLPRKLVARSGPAILAAIAEADSKEMQSCIEQLSSRQKPDRALLKALQERVKARAQDLGISAEVLATRRDLSALAAGAAPASLCEGWRAEALGKDLFEFVETERRH